MGKFCKSPSYRNLRIRSCFFSKITSLFISICNMEIRPCFHNARTIRSKDTLKFHRIPQQIMRDCLVCYHTHPIDFRIICHYRAYVRLPHSRFKRGSKNFIQFTVVQPGCGRIQSPLRLRISKEMLCYAGHPIFLVPLHPLYIMDSHLTD